MADVVLAHRQPTIRIPRVPNVEPGAQIALYWNGTIAPNGDGIPGGANPIDFTRPLHVSPMWLRGHPHLFGGPYGAGGYGAPGCDHDESHGYGAGPYGLGAYGSGGGWWTWKAANYWRNGVFELAARLRDWLGNENTTAIAELSIEIAAIPRSSDKAWVVSYAGGLLTIGWNPCPEFMAES